MRRMGLSERTCECGCGQSTRYSTRNGKPNRYVANHHSREPFEAKYVVSASGCWIWQRAFSNAGYGLMKDRERGVQALAHRVFYRLAHGEIPAGGQVHHVCGMKACVNPAHLEVLTASQHSRLRSKLTGKTAREVFELVHAGWQKIDIAHAYGVQSRLVKEVAEGLAWADATGVLP